MDSHKTKTHICHLVYSFNTGGLERIIANCINNLDREKFVHTIISLTDVGEFITEIDTPVRHYSLGKKSGNDLSVYFSLYRLFRQLRPDVLHTYNLGTIEYQWVAFFARVPLRIHAEHGRDSYDPSGSVKKYRLIRKVCSLVIHRVIAVSRDLQDWLINEVEIPESKVRLIINGVDTDFYKVGKVFFNKQNDLDHKCVFGHVARLHSIKNQMLMLTSFLNACKSSIEFREKCIFIIVGDGPDRNKLEQFVKKHSLLKNRVYFEGAKINVREFYQSFDVFLMSSIAEGIPMTLLESMSMSVPHLVTSVGGIKEVICEGRTGLAVKSGDIKAYTSGLIELGLNDELRKEMSVYSRKHILNKFSQNKMLSAYHDIYFWSKN